MAKDMFIQIKDCDGESTDKNHTNWIEMESWSWGCEQPASGSVSTGGARTSQRVQHRPFVFTHPIDAASSRLIQACCKGKHIEKATVDLMRATGDGNSTLYMQFELNDLVITKVEVATNAKNDGLPLERVEITYGKITWTYTQMDHKTGKAGGKITASHDLSTNTVA